MKRVVAELQDDINQLIGPTRITFAARKRRSIGNRVLRNGAICNQPRAVNDDGSWSQRCNGTRCQSCKLMAEVGEVFVINGMDLKVPSGYDCKTKFVIYCAQCTICQRLISMDDSYFGQTMNKLHQRINGHRSEFNNDDYLASALSMHAYEHHPDNFTLDIYKFCVVKSVHPLRLNREEFKHIEKFRTNCIGINRCKVQR